MESVYVALEVVPVETVLACYVGTKTQQNNWYGNTVRNFGTIFFGSTENHSVPNLLGSEVIFVWF